MQYALLIYRRPDEFAGLSDDEQRAVSAEYYALRDDPRVVGGAALKPTETATTMRQDESQTLITDGPYADTKEVFGGWYLVEANDLDGALEVAARIPALRLGGSIEVRPLMERPS
ncbi:MAG TPA: YciI family protein [Solirubrobacteraceae bacterium]|nr:YciI family protein [Solirubrobacteraceae bacterium]